MDTEDVCAECGVHDRMGDGSQSCTNCEQMNDWDHDDIADDPEGPSADT